MPFFLTLSNVISSDYVRDSRVIAQTQVWGGNTHVIWRRGPWLNLSPVACASLTLHSMASMR